MSLLEDWRNSLALGLRKFDALENCGLRQQADEFVWKRYGRTSWDTERVKSGYERMRSSSVLLCGLARSVAQILPYSIQRIELLASYFRDYRVIIFENDSEDATPELLDSWSIRNCKVHVISEQLNLPPAIDDPPAQRFRKMAAFRNRVHNEISSERFSSFEMVILYDLDVFGGFCIDGIADSFGVIDQADLIGANGININRYVQPWRFTSRYYDSLALRTASGQRLKGFNGAIRQVEPAVPTLSKSHLRFKPGQDLYPVSSCFGGLAIYHRNSYLQARYDDYDCEHICFHDAMRAKEFTRMFLNPNMILLH